MSVAVVRRPAHRARAGTKIWCSSGSVHATSADTLSARSVLGFLLEAVGEPFEKQQAEDVVLVVATVYGAAEDVSDRSEIPFELLDVQRVRRRARCPAGRATGCLRGSGAAKQSRGAAPKVSRL